MGTSFMPEFMKSKDVTSVDWRFTPILPLVFGTELSYMEMVAKLMQKVNEIIQNDNAQNNNVNGLIEAFKAWEEYLNEQSLADGSVTTQKLADGAVTAEKLAKWSVDNTHLTSECVNGEHIRLDSIQANHIGNGQITLNKLAREVLELLGNGEGSGAGSGVFYNCQNYGVTPDSSDNTTNMQALINLVHENGGGVIWMPSGVYRFDAEHSSRSLSANCQTCLVAKPGVSIIGESLTETVVKVYGSTHDGAAWIANLKTDIVYGCTYQNFSVDLADETIEQYSHKGKAFHQNGLRDCVFRDLRVLNTPATGLGIDRLDNVVVDSVYAYNCGREWTMGGPGGAGIGIGTGMLEHENFVVRNCICDSCGHFGLFLEDQGLFQSQYRNYPKGQIVANNIVRNGRNYGIGIRGGMNVVVTGNNLYENLGGIYLDMGAKNVSITNNSIVGYEKAGVLFGNEHSDIEGFIVHPCENVVVAGNTFIGGSNTIVTSVQPSNTQFANNYHLADAPKIIELDTDDLMTGYMLDVDGSQVVQSNGVVTDSVDISNFSGDIEITSIGQTGSMRVCQYDINMNPVADSFNLVMQTTDVYRVNKLDLACYIRIYYAPIMGSMVNIESITIKEYVPAPSTLTLTGDDFPVGIQLNADGSEAASTYGRTSDYLDVSSVTGDFAIKTTGNVESFRVCQYDSNRNSLETDAPILLAIGEVDIARKDGCSFIRIYYAPKSGSAASIGSVTISGTTVTTSDSIELDNSDFVVGVKLNGDGSEGTTTYGQTCDYLDVSGITDNFEIETVGTVDSLRVCQYDSEKNSLDTDVTTLPASGAVVVKRKDNCAFIRIYFSSVSGSSASIQSVTIRGTTATGNEPIELDSSDLVVGVKVNPDGSEGASSAGMATDYLSLPFEDTIKVTIRGTGSSVRIAQYNAAKESLSSDFPTTSISGTTENVLNVEMLTGCEYVRLYFSSLGEGQSATIDSVTIEQG